MTNDKSTEVASPAQVKNLEDLTSKISEHKGNTIRSCYEIGKLLREVYDEQEKIAASKTDEERDTLLAKSRFGINPIRFVEDAVGMNATELYRMRLVAIRFDDSNILKLCNTSGISWSHVYEAARVTDDNTRDKLIKGFPDLPSKDRTVRGFKELVDQALASPANAKALKEAAEQAGEGKKATGVRSGTGMGQGRSVLTAPKRAISCGEKFCDDLKNILIIIKEDEDLSDSKRKNLNEVLSTVAGILADIFAVGSGLVQPLEEYLAHNGASSMGASSRKSTYQEAAKLLAKEFVIKEVKDEEAELPKKAKLKGLSSDKAEALREELRKRWRKE